MRFSSLGPTGLLLAALCCFTVSHAGVLTIAWDDNSSSETGFKIERSNDGVTFAPVATVAPDTTTWSDATVVGGTCYYYRVAAFNATTTSTFSNVATATAPLSATCPAITSQPLSQTVLVGGNVSLTVSATGSPAPTFQWCRNGVSLNGATANTLALNNITTAAAGSYTVLISNSAGSVTSNPATITVNAPPSFTVQPIDASAQLAGTVTFSATAVGTPTPTLQWRKDGVVLQGATSTKLTLTNLTAQSAGTYTVVATSSAGSAVSSGAVLTVSGTAPVFVQQPVSQTVQIGQSAVFTVSVSGLPTPTLQWRKDGVALQGATATSLSLTNLTAQSAGTYTVVAINSAGSAVSSGAQLTVSGIAPVFVQQPVSQSVQAGQSVVFSVSVSGLPTPTLQWRKDGVAIAGATTTSLSLANVDAADAGSYSVTAANSAGVATSAAATLAISAPGKLTSVSAQAISAPWGASVLQLSFTLSGGSKALVVRGIGPGLAPFTSATLFADPVLKISAGTSLVASNDNWGGSASLADAFVRVGAFPLAPKSADAALLFTFPAGVLNAAIGGKSGGMALAEIYDADGSQPSLGRLTRVSARGSVGTKSALLTTTFVISGSTPVHLLIRALGPSLSGLPDVLNNPKLELYRGTALVAQNDNWGGTAALTALFKTAGATALSAKSKDAAIDVTLSPGIYSAVISPANTDSGLAQVEFYPLP